MAVHYSKITVKVDAPDKVVDNPKKETELSDATEQLKERIEDVCTQWAEDNDLKFGPLKVDVSDDS